MSSHDSDYCYARVPCSWLHKPELSATPVAGRWLLLCIYLYLTEQRRRTLPKSLEKPAFLQHLCGIDPRTAAKMLQKCLEAGVLTRTGQGEITIENIEGFAHGNVKWRDDPTGGNSGKLPGKFPIKEYKEEKSESVSGPAAPPELSQVLKFALEIGHPADDATRYHANRAGRAWRGIIDWRADFKTWAARYKPPTPPAASSRFDPDAVAPEILAAQQNRRAVREALTAAAVAAGRRLNRNEYLKLLHDDPALAAIPHDDQQHGVDAAVNSSEWLGLPAPSPGTPGPMAGVLARVAARVGT